MKKTLLLSAALAMASFAAQAQIITTYAGNGTTGYSGDGGPATAAQLGAADIAIDKKGNIYIADCSNHRIRKVDITGTITTIAGTGTDGFSGDGGPALAAQLSSPMAITIDTAGNIYIGDQGNERIRKIDLAGTITTIAGTGTYGSTGNGGPALAADIAPGYGIAADKFGNVYFTNIYATPLSAAQVTIRKIDAAGTITGFAGDGSTPGFSGDGGPATLAKLFGINRIAVDTNGNLYIADAGNSRVRKVDAATNIISTIAGSTYGNSGDGGPATAATMRAPSGLIVDTAGNIYIGDKNNYNVRRIDGVSGIITTIAGNGTYGDSGDGGLPTAAQLEPLALAIKGTTNLFIFSIQRVRVLNTAPHFIAGDTLSLQVCSDTTTVMDSLLRVMDADTGMLLSWSIVSPPVHGTIATSFNHWSVGDTIKPTGINYIPAAGYVGLDTFKVRVTDCIAADTITLYLKIAKCTEGIASPGNSATDILVYPNPTSSGQVNIHPSSPVTEEVYIVITDAVGRVVKELTTMSNQTTSITLNASSGIYMVKVILSNKTYNKTIWVE